MFKILYLANLDYYPRMLKGATSISAVQHGPMTSSLYVGLFSSPFTKPEHSFDICMFECLHQHVCVCICLHVNICVHANVTLQVFVCVCAVCVCGCSEPAVSAACREEAGVTASAASTNENG